MQENIKSKPGYKTTEFWTTLIANGIGLLVLAGVFQPEDSAEIVEKLNGIAGSVFLIISNAVYVFSRSMVKKEQVHGEANLAVTKEGMKEKNK